MTGIPHKGATSPRAKRLFSTLAHSPLIRADLMLVGRLDRAADRGVRGGEGAPGTVGSMLVSERAPVDVNALGDQIGEFCVAFVTKEQRLAAVSNKDQRIMTNNRPAHLELLRGAPAF